MILGLQRAESAIKEWIFESLALGNGSFNSAGWNSFKKQLGNGSFLEVADLSDGSLLIKIKDFLMLIGGNN